MKSELLLAFNEIAERSKLKREVVLEALENALVLAYRRSLNASAAQHVVAKVDLGTGAVTMYAEKEIVESVQDARTEVSLEEALRVNPNVKLGEMITVESTPKDFGRIAAQTAKQVILQRIREAERESQYQEYAEREGDIVNGTVQSVTGSAITLSLGRTEAILPKNQQVTSERYRPHDKLRAYVLEVRKTNRGPQIIVSRSHKNMLRRLLEYEVPEIYNGAVEIKSIAREAGHRSKVAVAAVQEGVDPVGACVGMRGVRIQSIVRELNDEKIDVIEWNPEQSAFIAKALSPARVSGVYLDDDPEGGRTALVVVPDDQLSLAIGREGQNARLAAKLTQWRIDIKSVVEAAGDALARLRAESPLAELAERLAEQIAAVETTLSKKAEGKPVTPEEYHAMFRLVDTVEKARLEHWQSRRDEYARRVAEVRAGIPAAAYQLAITEVGLGDKLAETLAEAGFETVGAVLEQLALNRDRILALNGVGPKTLEDLQARLGALTFAEPEAEPEPEPVPEPEAAPEVEAVAAREPLVAEAFAPPQPPLAPEAVPADGGEPAAEVDEAQAAPSAPLRAGAEAEAAPAALEEPLIEVEEFFEDEDEEDEASKKKKKKKGKSKAKRREIEFDEELGVYITKRKRKRDDGGEY